MLNKALTRLKTETATRRGKIATLLQAIRAKDEQGCGKSRISAL